jgi:hypothetical protein
VEPSGGRGACGRAECRMDVWRAGNLTGGWACGRVGGQKGVWMSRSSVGRVEEPEVGRTSEMGENAATIKLPHKNQGLISVRFRCVYNILGENHYIKGCNYGM